ncbi:MAG: hypothetical protein KDD60_06565, partial [Bdellovibrionales bacterium]|nr:hypothetical protein [Bdellovibrionales bacterium]
GPLPVDNIVIPKMLIKTNGLFGITIYESALAMHLLLTWIAIIFSSRMNTSDDLLLDNLARLSVELTRLLSVLEREGRERFSRNFFIRLPSGETWLIRPGEPPLMNIQPLRTDMIGIEFCGEEGLVRFLNRNFIPQREVLQKEWRVHYPPGDIEALQSALLFSEAFYCLVQPAKYKASIMSEGHDNGGHDL